MRLSPLLVAAFSLSVASASAGPLQKFAIDDVQAAIADAQAHNDTRHLPCWQAILPAVEQVQNAVHPPTHLGVAEGAQTFFDAKGFATSATVDNIVQACALTVADLKLSFVQFINMIGLNAALLK
jgi:hypothetical protein